MVMTPKAKCAREGQVVCQFIVLRTHWLKPKIVPPVQEGALSTILRRRWAVRKTIAFLYIRN